jgi:hypothetical protein
MPFNGIDRRAPKPAVNRQGALYREETLAPKRLFQALCINLILIVSLMIPVFPTQAKELPASDTNFTRFVDSVRDGQTGMLRGVYAEGALSLLVVQQPSTQPAFVSSALGVVTEFQAAKAAGNVGLLAHNYLAGKDFAFLAPGQEVRAVFGDGKVEYFKITKILRFKTLQPKSVTSDFIDLDNGKLFTATQVFERVYRGARHLTFQTCIYKDGNSSWGRLFVMAEPFIP